MMRKNLTITALVILPFLAACSTVSDDNVPSNATSDHSAHSVNQSNDQSADRSAAIWIDDAWVKAGTGMSGMFGEIHNNTDEAVTITGLSSDVAGIVQLHEVTFDGKMQEISEPVEIPAQGSITLRPGGNHIMLMEMPGELLPGDSVTVTVELSNGISAPLTALVKDYAGANESYDDIAHSDAGGHSHSEHDDSEKH